MFSALKLKLGVFVEMEICLGWWGCRWKATKNWKTEKQELNSVSLSLCTVNLYLCSYLPQCSQKYSKCLFEAKMGGLLGLNASCLLDILFLCFTVSIHILVNTISLLIKLTTYNSEVFDFLTTLHLYLWAMFYDINFFVLIILHHMPFIII